MMGGVASIGSVFFDDLGSLSSMSVHSKKASRLSHTIQSLEPEKAATAAAADGKMPASVCATNTIPKMVENVANHATDAPPAAVNRAVSMEDQEPSSSNNGSTDVLDDASTASVSSLVCFKNVMKRFIKERDLNINGTLEMHLAEGGGSRYATAVVGRPHDLNQFGPSTKGRTKKDKFYFTLDEGGKVAAHDTTAKFNEALARASGKKRLARAASAAAMPVNKKRKTSSDGVSPSIASAAAAVVAAAAAMPVNKKRKTSSDGVSPSAAPPAAAATSVAEPPQSASFRSDQCTWHDLYTMTCGTCACKIDAFGPAPTKVNVDARRAMQLELRINEAYEGKVALKGPADLIRYILDHDVHQDNAVMSRIAPRQSMNETYGMSNNWSKISIADYLVYKVAMALFSCKKQKFGGF